MRIALFILSLCCCIWSLGAILPTGAEVPEPELRGWVKGRPFKLADFKGKAPVVLFFWTATDQGAKPFEAMTALAARNAAHCAFLAIGSDTPASIRRFFRLPQLGMPVAADKQLATLEQYMRTNDKLPMAAIINQDGKLVWRGDCDRLEPVLQEVIAGKYDLQQAVRQEKITLEIDQALAERNYDRVLALADAALREYPDSVELISLKVRILSTVKKDPAAAETFLDSVVKQNPKRLVFYELAIYVLRGTGEDQKLDQWVDRLIANAKDAPLQCLKLAHRELTLPVTQSRPGNAYKLAAAAWENSSGLPARDRGMIALEFAKILSHCARPDRAVELAKEAEKLLKGKEKQGAAEYVQYYQSLVKLAPQL